MTTPDHGLLGPLMKAYAHLYFLHFAAAYNFTIDDTDIQAEAWAGVEHLAGIIATTPMLTTAATDAKDLAIASLRASTTTANPAAINAALAALANFTRVMDTELLGITDAAIDPAGA